MDTDRQTAEEIVFESSFNQYNDEEDEFDRELRHYEESSNKRSLADFEDDDEEDKSTRSKFANEREFNDKIVDSSASNKRHNTGASSNNQSQHNRPSQSQQNHNRNSNNNINRNRSSLNQNKNVRSFPFDNRREPMLQNDWMNQPPHFFNLQSDPMSNHQLPMRSNFNDNFNNQPQFLPPFNRPAILHPVTNQPLNGPYHTCNRNNNNTNGFMNNSNFMNNMNLNHNNNNFRNRPPTGPRLGPPPSGPFNNHHNNNISPYQHNHHQINNIFHPPNNGPNFNQARPPLIPNFHHLSSHHQPKLEPPFVNQPSINHNSRSGHNARANLQNNKPLINQPPIYRSPTVIQQQSHMGQNTRPVVVAQRSPNSFNNQVQHNSRYNQSNSNTNSQSNLRTVNLCNITTSDQNNLKKDQSHTTSIESKTALLSANASRNLKLLNQEAALVGILPIKKIDSCEPSEANVSLTVLSMPGTGVRKSDQQIKVVDTTELRDGFAKKTVVADTSSNQQQTNKTNSIKISNNGSAEKAISTINSLTNNAASAKPTTMIKATDADNMKERTVKIRNLALSCKIEDILSICNSIGPTESLNISITDGDKNAIVVFKNKQDTSSFQRRYNLTMLDQSLIKVEFV